jgi:calcium-dependent protein kinase
LNGNGSIDYTEWIMATSNMKEVLNDLHLKSVFDFFDIYNRGAFGATELRATICNNDVNDSVWRSIILEADTLKHGKILYPDFRRMMLKLLDSEKQKMKK